VIGAAMTWVATSTLRDAYRARDWVKVRAEVTWAELARSSRPMGGYRYEYGGQEYESNRLGFANAGVGILDEWPADMHAYLSLARSEKRPIMVWMNPANPEDAVVDRELRGATLLLVFPFAMLCDGAAFLTLRAAWRRWRDFEPEPRKLAKGELNALQALVLGLNCFLWWYLLVWEPVVGGSSWTALWFELLIAIGLVALWYMVATIHDHWDEFSFYEDDDD
jgi:hypothetical protein